ncbi:hypothetical protein KC19_9G167900 [Ceratodon purpureus]|uniref:DUF7748 domain-containing protein n=1 Tax=Ceratodon purpureus TaxID=3225 RepID=A0A8T0GUP9_CERPU|nr:hypothetical protein KC19_9G167900 [Ceratodon purpureus]
MVLKTNVTNKSAVRIVLKQGSANIYSKLSTLQPDGHADSVYTISLESNTTYREYWCAVQPGSEGDDRVIFSSDDCAEYKEVKIIELEPPGSKKYGWVGTVPRAKKADDASKAGDHAPPTLWKKFIGLFTR